MDSEPPTLNFTPENISFFGMQEILRTMDGIGPSHITVLDDEEDAVLEILRDM